MTEVRSASNVTHNPGRHPVNFNGCAQKSPVQKAPEANGSGDAASHENTDKSSSSLFKSIMFKNDPGQAVKPAEIILESVISKLFTLPPTKFQ